MTLDLKSTASVTHVNMVSFANVLSQKKATCRPAAAGKNVTIAFLRASGVILGLNCIIIRARALSLAAFTTKLVVLTKVLVTFNLISPWNHSAVVSVT